MQMKNHTSKEAFYERLRNLADVNKTSVKESTNRTLGTLIDYKRAADGVAYGIIKEQHQYYVKKAGTKQDPNVSDFAYIGGLSNITNFQYKSLAEADKQRNMMFHTITEAVALKPNKNGSKKKLNEDRAGQEIDQAASKLGDLDAATAAEEMPAPAVDGAEMAAGLEAMPADTTADPLADPTAAPAPEADPTADPLADPTAAPAGDEVAPEGDAAADLEASLGGDETAPEGDAVAPEGDETDADAVDVAANNVENGSEVTRELDKAIGKITNTIRKTELEPAQTKSYINSFIASFKDKLPKIDIEDRKEMANRLIKVINPDEIEDLGDSVPQDGEDVAPEAVAEEQCAECGGFAQYAESRGYDSAQSLIECGEEEVGNLVSGYANAHNDGQNDGDLENVALVLKLINPEILDKLRSEYGHEEYADKLQPQVDAMSESLEADNLAKLNELFGGAAPVGKTGVAPVQAVKPAAPVVPAAGIPAQTVEAVDPANTEVSVPNMLKEEDEELEKDELEIGGEETPETGEEKEETPFEAPEEKKDSFFAPAAQSLGVGTVKPDGAPTTIRIEPDKSVEITMNEAKKRLIKSIAEGVNAFMAESKPKPTVIKEVKKESVVPKAEVMTESEQKLRKYIRMRLEERAGVRKPNLNENKKSPALKKLDATIDEQFKLYESVVKKKVKK